MIAILKLLRQSRPIFWVYTGGLYLLGAVWGAVAVHTRVPWESALFLCAWAWFAWGENFFGVFLNDYFDRNIDARNPRKRVSWDEWLAPASWMLVALSVLAYLPLALSFQKLWLYGLVLLVGNILYDVPPVRLKIRPPFDLLIGACCALPPLFGSYTLVSGEWPPFWAILTGVLIWIGFDFVDKLYDAKADAAAGLTTTATALGLSAQSAHYRFVQWIFVLVGTALASYVWYLYLS
jgi:lycopene elongase/hydratase (dihydrobisanhydrobacterioruberin-forming)